jgi:hypothetical protein
MADNRPVIVARDHGSLHFVTQPDHARFAAELLSLWRADGMPEHPRRAELLFAVREHDNGWREADAAPRWNAGLGRPHDFTTTPREDRIEIWQRGTARFAGEHPYASLLVTHHALRLHQDRPRTEGWADFLDYLGELQQGLLESLGIAEGDLAADYRWLDLADLISLAVCNRWSGPFERHGVRGHVRSGPDLSLALDPFPLAGATTFRIPCRSLPERPYAGDADLAVELAQVRWGTLAVKVVEPGP